MSKTIALPRGLFIANQVCLLAEVAFAVGMCLTEQKKRHKAEREQMNTLLMAAKIFDYADKSMMPQKLIDEFKFRCMTALYDVPADPLDTPEEEK